MKEDYLITVIGTQETQGEKETIETTTVGEYEQTKDKKFIRYKEYSDSEPVISVETEIEIDNSNIVKIKRKGEITSQLVLEKGKRNICDYKTSVGNIIIGIYTNFVEDRLDSDGGYIKAEYEVDFGDGFFNLNKLIINIKKNKDKVNYVKNK